MNRSNVFIFFLLTVFMMCLLTSCDNPSAEVSSFTDCKYQDTTPTDGKSYPSNQECIEYEYDGSILHITHINTNMTCAIDDVLLEIDVTDGVITIDETEWCDEPDGACMADCICLYDVEIDIINITPDQYELIFLKDITTTIDLSEPGSDVYCEDRDQYPWI